MSLLAKAVVKNKFWILENEGKQIGAIISGPQGVVLISKEKRERFSSFELLKDRYNILVEKSSRPAKAPHTRPEVYKFPANAKPYNELWDVPRKVPVFTKRKNSKSFHCAGYYVLTFEEGAEVAFCPKLITINRYEYIGPFQTKEQAVTKLKESVTYGPSIDTH